MFPKVEFTAHFHDTPGAGIVKSVAMLEMGSSVDEYARVNGSPLLRAQGASSSVISATMIASPESG